MSTLLYLIENSVNAAEKLFYQDLEKNNSTKYKRVMLGVAHQFILHAMRAAEAEINQGGVGLVASIQDIRPGCIEFFLVASEAKDDPIVITLKISGLYMESSYTGVEESKIDNPYKVQSTSHPLPKSEEDVSEILCSLIMAAAFDLQLLRLKNRI